MSHNPRVFWHSGPGLEKMIAQRGCGVNLPAVCIFSIIKGGRRHVPGTAQVPGTLALKN